MTVAEAAGRLGISRSKLYGLVAARRIAHYRIGGKILFLDADLAAFLARCRVDVAQGQPPPTPRPVPRLKHLKLA